MQLILRDTRTLLFGRWACLSIGFMLFVVEWHYNQGQQEDMYVISIVLSYPTLLLSPFLCLYAAYFNLHNQSVRVSHWISSVLAASGMVFVIALLQAVIVHTGVLRSGKFILIQLFMMPAWTIFGLILGQRVDEARRLLGWLAIGCAVGSLLSGFFWIVLPPNEVGLIERASWPMRLVFLFGFFWFLAHWLASKRLLDWNLMGLLACLIEVGVSLHKPVIFGLGVGMVGFFWLSNRHNTFRYFYMRITKILLFFLVLVIALFVVERVSHGAVSDTICKFWYQAVWHVDYDSDMKQVLSDRSEAIELAAGGRLDMWQIAMQTFARKPLLGSGFPEAEVKGGAISIHNGYLDWLLAFGILGTLPVVCIWWNWLRAMLRHRPYANPANEVAILAVTSYILAISAFNLGGTSRLFAHICYFIGLVAGITFSVAMNPEVNVHRWPGQSPWVPQTWRRQTIRRNTTERA